MAAKTNKAVPEGTSLDPRVLDELRSIRQLMLLLLAKLNSTPEEIGMALGVTASRVRDLISVRKVEKLPLWEE